ncbi:hypothetical protein [Shewanella japonica]|uniref:hypothetical protein n=1 Tax=Shewanella japonica TaxID=93973 RepID=UPI0012DDE2FA|nr:hypothetical protein [Shewanella japonica]
MNRHINALVRSILEDNSSLSDSPNSNTINKDTNSAIWGKQQFIQPNLASCVSFNER